MPNKPFWIALAALTALTAATPAICQSAAPTLAAATDLDAAPAPESGAPDPLAPTRSEGPVLAPGTPAKAAVTAAAATTDPIVMLVREQMAGFTAHRSDRRDDVAAVSAYYAETQQPVWTTKDGLSPKAKQTIAELAKADDWGLKAAAFDVPVLTDPAPAAQAVAEAEIKLSLAVLKYARHARGGRLDPASVSKKFDQKPTIYEPQSVLQALAATEAADAYLRATHPQHPQFERLRQGLLAARAAQATDPSAKSTVVSPAQIVANMERWRWMPIELGSFFVWDSIPDQMTRVYDNGAEVLAEKIVVGKITSPTPIFSADMQFVIFHPSWGVPSGIKSFELAPQLRNTNGGWFSSNPLASSVLRAHGLQVRRNGVPVDPDQIEWSGVDIQSFEFTQPPGATNVLGMVKFRFPNKHDVYMHDTPERNLFGGKVRAFSHGCMRVQNPVHLAEVLLAHDKGWSVEKVREQSRSGSEITLSTPIPVHVTYFTVTVDEAGTLTSYPDIYGLDSRVASALEGREVQIVTGSISTDDAEAPPRRQSTSAGPRREASSGSGQASRARQRAKPAQAPKPFDPIAALFGQ